MSKIEWTDHTWNPVTGCTKCSPGCVHCYAEVMARRLHGIGNKKYRNGFMVTLHPEELETPKKWKKPSKIFVCSMSDLFHENVPVEYIEMIMQIIEECPQHTFLILTKRSRRMRDYFGRHRIPKNIWLGVTIENQENIGRMYDLVDINLMESIKIKIPKLFISCEPLLGPIHFASLVARNRAFDQICWLICGGESGPVARPGIKTEWIHDLRDQCKNHDIPFFFKQWGTWGPDGVKRDKKRNGSLLSGEIVQEWPEEDQ